MARIRIKVPAQFDFTCEIPIRITDLNYGGHVGNDTVLSLLHEARMQYLKHFGIYNEMDGLNGYGIIVADVGIVYKAETFYGSIALIRIAAADFHAYGFDLVYQIVDKTTDKLLTEAKTGIICFDYQQRKIAKLPEDIRERLQKND